MRKWNWREGQRPHRRQGGGQRRGWFRGSRQRATWTEQWYSFYLFLWLSRAVSVTYHSLLIFARVCFTGVSNMIRGHHLEHLRDMKISQHLPLLHRPPPLPPLPPPHLLLLPLRPAMLHQVGPGHHLSLHMKY